MGLTVGQSGSTRGLTQLQEAELGQGGAEPFPSGRSSQELTGPISETGSEYLPPWVKTHALAKSCVRQI